MMKTLSTLLIIILYFADLAVADSPKVAARNAYAVKMLDSADKIAVFVKGAC